MWLRLIERVRTTGRRARGWRLWGPLVFGRRWESQRVPDLLHALAWAASSGPNRLGALPGHTADQVALHQVVSSLGERSCIGRLASVADRGMIAGDTVDSVVSRSEAPFGYVVG